MRTISVTIKGLLLAMLLSFISCSSESVDVSEDNYLLEKSRGNQTNFLNTIVTSELGYDCSDIRVTIKTGNDPLSIESWDEVLIGLTDKDGGFVATTANSYFAVKFNSGDYSGIYSAEQGFGAYFEILYPNRIARGLRADRKGKTRTPGHSTSDPGDDDGRDL
jgi:hypothetical protein